MIETVGILLAIALIIFLAMKGFSIIIVAPIASILVILSNGMDFFPALIGGENSYMTGLAGFVINYFRCVFTGCNPRAVH